MKNSDRMLEAAAIGRATQLLEQMNTRLAAAGRGWRDRQLADWQTLRQICNQQIARMDLIEKPEDTKAADLFRPPQQGQG